VFFKKRNYDNGFNNTCGLSGAWLSLGRASVTPLLLAESDGDPGGAVLFSYYDMLRLEE
jgi:hypothetical protein